MDDDNEIDLEILGVFLEEAEESMAELDARFVALEKDPKDRESVDGIFRVIHTIKGNAAFFGLMGIKRLAHQMEDLLSLMREGRIQVTPPRINALLKGVDFVRLMLSAVREEKPELANVNKDDVVEIGKSLEAMSKDADDESSDLSFVLHHLDTVIAHVGDLQTLREKVKQVRVLVSERQKREVDKAPGGEASAQAQMDEKPNLDSLVELLAKAPLEAPTDEEAEAIANLLRDLDSGDSDAERELVAKMISEHESMVSSVGFVPLLREVLLESAQALQALVSQRQGVETEDQKKVDKPRKREAAGRTMRVEEAKIDQFLDYVGDLIIVREMFVNVGKRLREDTKISPLSSDYQHALEAFSVLSHSLQESIMAVRKVSIKGVLQKVPRMARDLASAREKEVRVEIYGESASVDKSLLETLEGPLTHMVRNAVDHGIESPEIRESRGKDRCGTLIVRAHEEREVIRIDVSDDGGGIDETKLKAKALTLGLISDHQAKRMRREEVFELLFAPGLSTAEKVTDISGRGVGMDVVRRNVVELGGDISITSELGKGTTFSLQLPKAVTVQILDGFLVRVNGERFILPLQSIKESFRPDQDHVVTVASTGEYISRRGQVLPLLRFGEVLSLASISRKSACDSIVVSVDVSGKGPAGLLVDEVLGVQQVVLREVHGIETANAPFSGGAVLGDGRVAMVVDVDRLGGLVHA